MCCSDAVEVLVIEIRISQSEVNLAFGLRVEPALEKPGLFSSSGHGK